VAATSALGIFDRPMEPVDVAATTEAAEPAAPKKTDLEKYLLLAQEPMNTDVLAWWKLRDHNEAANPSTGRPEGLPHLARMVRQWLGAPATSALVLSVSSPRRAAFRAACTTTSRARWRTAPWSTPSSPPPTASSGWSLESRSLEAQNRDEGAHRTGYRDRCTST
jgi:hypothetical protein